MRSLKQPIENSSLYRATRKKERDGQTDRQTDRQTDGRSHSLIQPYTNGRITISLLRRDDKSPECC